MTFGLVKHNNNSISAVTSVGLTQGKMTLIKEQTASSSASISFVDGSSSVVLDNTYPIYIFKFINIHPATNDTLFEFNLSTDSGSNYNVTKTTTLFRARHTEGGGTTELVYRTFDDLAQGTDYQHLTTGLGNDNDQSFNGTLHLFNPSSTTFVKHFLIDNNESHEGDGSSRTLIGGYGNTTSAVDAIQFRMSSGNIDAGTIKLYGIKGS